MASQRRLPVGAEVTGEGVHFRVWAPRRQRVWVALESGRARGEHALDVEPGGYFSGLVAGGAAGDLYRFHFGEADRFPDPASRFQPEGPHGPSQVVDHTTFAWTDASWKGVSL